MRGANPDFRREGFSSRLENGLPRFFKNGDDLITLYTRKTFQELVDRIAAFEMIEEAFHRHPRPYEHHSTAEDFRVRMIDQGTFHESRLMQISPVFKLHPVT